MQGLKIRTKLIFSIISGTLTGAAYYPSYLLNTLTGLDCDFGFLGLIAPLFFILALIHTRKVLAALLYGFLFGFFFTLNSLSWFAVVTFIGLIASGIVVGVFFTAILGLLIMIFARKNGFLTPVLIASAWVTSDYIFSIFPLRTPWGFVGYTAIWNEPFVQIADIFGVWGVTFLMIFVQAVIACAILSFRQHKQNINSRVSLKEARTWRKMLIVSVALLVFAHIYGIIRIIQLDDADEKGFTVALMQPSIPQGLRNEKYNFARQIDERMQDLFNAVEKAPLKIGEYEFASPVFKDVQDIATDNSLRIIRLTDKPVQLVVDSETSFNYQFEQFVNLGEKYRFYRNVQNYIETAQRNGWFMQISAVEEPKNEDFKEYPPDLVRGRNCSHLVSPKGEIIGTYQKVELVPVGEFVPFLEYTDILYSFIHNNVGRAQHFEPGKNFTIFKLPDDSKRVEKNIDTSDKSEKDIDSSQSTQRSFVETQHCCVYAVAICFESNFPYVNRELTKAGAKTIILHSNDGWFLETVEPEQIWTQARMRAIENRVGYLRAVNSGITGACDSLGRIIAVLERDGEKKGVAGALILDVPVGTGNSIYVALGDVLPKFCIVLLITSLLILLLKQYFVKQKLKQI